ncbi:macrophage mannose receptor 1-like [Diadema setosum]|uniref:macrophage mannose receptor 1-like n=1 Tax=Diadema setosum TaxID=31175 RepID=UPI003B3B6166
MEFGSTQSTERCEEGGDWQRWDYNADLDTCYLFMGSDSANRVTWFDALSRCSAEQSDMVSVHSKDENYFVQELVIKNGVTVMWLGMYDQETHGGFQWTDESPANYFKWDANEPGNSVTSCVSIDSETGGWKLKDCGETMSFMCKKNLGGGSVTPAPTERAAGYCPKGWVTWGNKCLQVQDHLDSWTSARNHCMVLGGDLASVRDDKEEALAVSLLENVAGPVWLGLNDRDHEGLFTWADGSPVFHTNWATNEPNNWGGQENCVHMYGSDGALPGTWNDAECTQQYYSLCQRPRDPDGTPVAPTLSLCQSYYHYGNSCFKLYNGSYTRDEAEALCVSDGLGSTLASINSVYEHEKILLMMATEGITSPMYIGLTFADHRFSWDDGWPVSYTNWGHGEPSLGPLETCTILNPATDRWSDIMCNETHGAVCKFTFDTRPVQPTVSPEDCPSEEWVPFGGACYRGFFNDDQWVRWAGAEYACPTYDSHMVSLHSDEEVNFVLSLIPDDTYSIWIGLNRIEDLAFEWEDNSPFEYIMWAPGEPSGTGGDSQEEECTQMYTRGNSAGQWNDLNCYEKLPYVCKYTVYGLRPGTTPDGGDNPGTDINIGLVVGATLGGIVFLVVLVILLALLKRQKRMVAYFRSVAGLEVAPEELFNEDEGRRGDIDGDESARENFGRNDSQRSFDDAMLSIN